jgi:hypothetical protein
MVRATRMCKCLAGVLVGFQLTRHFFYSQLFSSYLFLFPCLFPDTMILSTKTMTARLWMIQALTSMMSILLRLPPARLDKRGPQQATSLAARGSRTHPTSRECLPHSHVPPLHLQNSLRKSLLGLHTMTFFTTNIFSRTSKGSRISSIPYQ